jgi:methylmalonyl-CoA/ethylmalonyl-CoA epimerase
MGTTTVAQRNTSMSSPQQQSPFSNIDHLGIVASDIDAAAEHYETLGIGPFKPPKEVIPAEFDEHVEMGDFVMRTNFVDLGSVKMEIIQPVSGDSSEFGGWQEFLESNGDGVHHVGFEVEDLAEQKARLQEQGAGVYFEMDFPSGGGAVYLDTAAIGGVILELIEWPRE